MSTQANLLFGKYKLLEIIARGGMAEVFKAKSYGVDGFEKLVVIKRILPDLAQNHTFVEMCINEAKLSVALSHANIVQVFDLGREEDTYFIVMEYVNGMDFAETLRRCRRASIRPPPELCVYIAGETARALDYAHRRRDAQMRPLGIVHRDVSPQNILVSLEGEVKVTDFGIAKARTTIDDAGAIKGKYAYMAPEQARGQQDVDARADIYALGIVLYESLAGKNPFQEATPYQTLRRVQAGEKPPLKLACPDVPEDLARIVETALMPDPDQRYPTAAKFYEDLAGYLYTTGKRVASHDLAEWLTQLSGAATREDDSHRMRDALEDIEPSAVKTPVEVPTGASHASRPGPSTSAGLSRPHLERRDVTLVSVELGDSVGSGTSAFEALMPIASRFGGVVVDATEHHVVLIFGAQEPDGRDTETAVRCSLKLAHAAQQTADLPAIGIGIHAARVHVNAEGAPERDQWFTSAVALVRDLGRAAGTRILASEPVGRLVSEQFTLEPLRSRTANLERVAGTPLNVLAERPMHEGAHRRFVGRKDAFRKFGEVLARSSKRGARALALIGDAGAGKTRFLDEVLYRLRRMNHAVNWYAAACLPHQRDVPLSAVQSLLRAILGIDDADPDRVVREKALRLRELGLSEDEQRAVNVLVGASVEHDAASSAHALRSAVLRMATSLAQDQLTVFLWDSAENMDDESQAVVDDVLRSAERSRIVVIAACRPGFIYAWKDAPGVEEIVLTPLTDEETHTLVAQRLGVPLEKALPKELLEDLWGKGSGNPLFIEEYVRSLQESGGIEIRGGDVVYRREVAEVGVPKTLRGLVASEIVRLSAPQRAVLQLASVIGPRFSKELLVDAGEVPAHQIATALRALTERGTIVQTGADEFAFAHDLRREVLYDGLPLDVRRQLHATVAAAMERLYPDRLDEHAERLAHHHREASDRGKAIDYLVRAARRQEKESSYSGAAANLARAIELVLASPRSDAEHVMALYAQLGSACIRGRLVDLGINKLQLGLAYAEDLGDKKWLVKMLILLGKLFGLANRIADAVTELERAHSLVDPAGGRSELGEIASAIGDAFARNGEFKRAHGYLEEAARLADERGDRRDAALALTVLARCEGAAGERDRALDTAERARATARGISDPVMQVELEKCVAMVHFHTRDFASAVTHFERALELAREFGIPYEICVNAHNCGDAWLRLGDYKKAFAALMTSVNVAHEHGFEKLTHLNNVFLAFIDAARFGSAEGRATVEAALAYAESKGYTWDVLHAKYLLGVLAKERGDRDKARVLLRDALALANETDNRMYAEDCEMLLREVSTVPPVPTGQPVR